MANLLSERNNACRCVLALVASWGLRPFFCILLAASLNDLCRDAASGHREQCESFIHLSGKVQEL